MSDNKLIIECHLWKEYRGSSVWLCTPIELDMDKYWHVYMDYAGFTRSEAVDEFKKRLAECNIEAEVIVVE